MTLLELRWIYSLKSVSDLNCKNIAEAKTENSFWPANFVFVQLRYFFSLKFSNFAGWIRKLFFGHCLLNTYSRHGSSDMNAWFEFFKLMYVFTDNNTKVQTYNTIKMTLIMCLILGKEIKSVGWLNFSWYELKLCFFSRLSHTRYSTFLSG